MSEKILETERLILRRWTLADADALFVLLSDARVAHHIGDGKPFTMQKVTDFLAWAEDFERVNGFCRWKVIEKSTGQTIGSCGFGRMKETSEIEFGYLFAQNCWGRGFATEIAGAAIDYGFKKLGFREIIAITDAENVASQKVLRKIGFRPRGVERFGGKESLVFIKKKSDD